MTSPSLPRHRPPTVEEDLLEGQQVEDGVVELRFPLAAQLVRLQHGHDGLAGVVRVDTLGLVGGELVRRAAPRTPDPAVLAGHRSAGGGERSVALLQGGVGMQCNCITFLHRRNVMQGYVSACVCLFWQLTEIC